MPATCIAVDVAAHESSVGHADIVRNYDLVRCRSRVTPCPCSAQTRPTASVGCTERGYLPIESHSTSSGLVQPGMWSPLRAIYRRCQAATCRNVRGGSSSNAQRKAGTARAKSSIRLVFARTIKMAIDSVSRFCRVADGQRAEPPGHGLIKQDAHRQPETPSRLQARTPRARDSPMGSHQGRRQ